MLQETTPSKCYYKLRLANTPNAASSVSHNVNQLELSLFTCFEMEQQIVAAEMVLDLHFTSV